MSALEVFLFWFALAAVLAYLVGRWLQVRASAPWEPIDPSFDGFSSRYKDEERLLDEEDERRHLDAIRAGSCIPTVVGQLPGGASIFNSPNRRPPATDR